jgi:hypothetical protein
MGQKQHKQQKTTRKKYYHTHDAALPSIEVTPKREKKSSPYLPKVIVDNDTRISRRNIQKVQAYLQFADPHDLRYLSCIRIVAPSAIKLPSKEFTDGCYWPKWENREPEIWLSTSLFKFPGLKWTLMNMFILKENRLFETIFHELGHHKASHIRLVSKYKQEAYAEKYMQAYKSAWQKRQRWTNIFKKMRNGLLALLMNRYFVVAYFYTIRKRDATTQRVYQLYVQYALRKITQEELWEQMKALIPKTYRTQKKKKWEHPLRQQKYRDKFRLDGQEEDV